MTTSAATDGPLACDYCGHSRTEICWSDLLKCLCCRRCYLTQTGPATPRQLRKLTELWQHHTIIPATGLSRHAAEELILTLAVPSPGTDSQGRDQPGAATQA